VFVASLSDIVSLSISSNSRTVSREGFGTPLVLTYHTRFADTYREYSTLAEMAADGFASHDDAYRMAAAAFAQDPTVEQVIVGRLSSAPSFVTQLTMTSAVEGQVVKATVLCPEAGTLTDPVVTGGVISPTGALSAGTAVTIEYTIQAAATTSSVATAIEVLFEAIPGVASSPSSAIVSLTPATAGRKVHAYDLQYCTIEETTADADYDDALTTLQVENDDWYVVTADTCSAANITKLAAWVLANKKLYFVATSSSGELAGTGTIGSGLLALSNNRTVVIYNKNTHEFGGPAWAGVGLPQDPGSINWAYKTLLGVTSGALTSTQEGYLEADNINHYQPLAGLSGTRWGVVTSGEYIDVIHGTDALEARIKEDVYALFMNTAKVPYTDAGLDLIYSAILAALRAFEGTDNEPGLLVRGSSTVIMPRVSSISSVVKATRDLPGIRFSATYEGAVNSVGITGVISV
jgi:hypothetical protein